MMSLWKWLPIFFLCVSPPARTQEPPPPLSLGEVFEAAVRQSEGLQIQEQEIRAAEGRYWQALGGALPHLTATGTELIQDTSGTEGTGDTFGSTFLRRSTPEVAVTFRQPLFQGFREFRALRGSRADRRKGALEWERGRQLLYLDVATLFLSVKELEREKEILASQEGLLAERVRELKERVRLGRSRRSEILTTESQQAQLKAQLAQTEGRLSVARETLAFLSGLEIPSLTEPEPALPDLAPLETYLARAEDRPDTLASAEDLTLTQSRLSYERGGYLPQLNLEANYYPYRVGFRDPIDWDLLFTLEVPLFEGGKTRGLVKEAKARLLQAELAQRESQRRARLEIEETYVTLAASREELRSLEQAVEKARENYQTQQREYRLGLVNNLDVLQSRRDWHQVEREKNQAHYRALLNSFRLQIALGSLP